MLRNLSMGEVLGPFGGLESRGDQVGPGEEKQVADCVAFSLSFRKREQRDPRVFC